MIHKKLPAINIIVKAIIIMNLLKSPARAAVNRVPFVYTIANIENKASCNSDKHI